MFVIVIIFSAIFIIMGAIGTVYIHANEDKFYCYGYCFGSLFEQNQHIIKQNDWLICAKIYSIDYAYVYEYEKEFGHSSYVEDENSYGTYAQLVKLCGEPPQ